MERLHHVKFMDIVFIGILFCTGVVKATGQDEITPIIFPLDETHSEYIMNKFRNDCECIEYNCECCQHLQWDVISVHGKLCVNASYLEKGYGFSLTITYNNFAIISKTISVGNPPPICLGEDISSEVDVDVCLRLYNIYINNNKFLVCFEIYGERMKLLITKIKLGCIDQTKQRDKIKYTENNSSKLFLKKMKNDELPIVNKDYHGPGIVKEIEICHRNREKSEEDVCIDIK
ncbi:PREDICTED: uncharacterized protein LOC108763174 [Trachymyrmex cornetzi]|uniref:uncharacterized protein LOC108763174 n=1 Tax=Trachymyrmex cornetzi TaxID=471704 RepID=UPI00084F77AE|nr:PREDICTED: uncharacterized protein LOC108763174 [Trachymyrmex cornetzi]